MAPSSLHTGRLTAKSRVIPRVHLGKSKRNVVSRRRGCLKKKPTSLSTSQTARSYMWLSSFASLAVTTLRALAIS
ncbi:hypothetical protein P691DRAFT_807746, partial [Macrolepiota fuliginosa MF-IS2]